MSAVCLCVLDYTCLHIVWVVCMPRSSLVYNAYSSNITLKKKLCNTLLLKMDWSWACTYVRCRINDILIAGHFGLVGLHQLHSKLRRRSTVDKGLPGRNVLQSGYYCCYVQLKISSSSSYWVRRASDLPMEWSPFDNTDCRILGTSAARVLYSHFFVGLYFHKWNDNCEVKTWIFWFWHI